MPARQQLAVQSMYLRPCQTGLGTVPDENSLSAGPRRGDRAADFYSLLMFTGYKDRGLVVTVLPYKLKLRFRDSIDAVRMPLSSEVISAQRLSNVHGSATRG